MADPIAVLQSKKRRTLTPFKTLKETIDNAGDDLISSFSGSQSEIAKLKGLICELTLHLSDASEALETFANLVYEFNEKKNRKKRN